MEELLALLQDQNGNLDEESLRRLMESGLLGEELDSLHNQMGLANELRTTPMPEGRMAGRTFVAANPLEFAAAAFKQDRGDDQMKDLIGKNEALLDKTRGGALDFLLKYLRQGKGGNQGLPMTGSTLTSAEWD